ncbi:EcsC family protein [Brachybacterium sp. Marseille-Q7125]|uniref:EcsC family protein n=1 Tax=Brachybacterium sp. Marseille-Q7125 TaxID=2932815 RepID=UPI001FF2F39D|nr:EcsC family protein [Brachybacterium sp. Marseille-Q7125]
MGIFSMLRRDKQATRTAREAMKQARSGAEPAAGGPLERIVRIIRDWGLDGKLTYSSAQTVADRALRGRGARRADKAVRRIIASHRRGVTAGGFLTGLGGFVTLPILLPTNVVEFYVQATRMVGAIAAVRGYDLDDEEIRMRVMAALLGEEQGEVLKNVGLGPVAGVAARTVARGMKGRPEHQLINAIGGRLLRRFSLRSVRLFGKAIPGAGAILGAWSDRRQLSKIARAAQEAFPAQA